jgi:hypothetical protein
VREQPPTFSKPPDFGQKSTSMVKLSGSGAFAVIGGSTLA